MTRTATVATLAAFALAGIAANFANAAAGGTRTDRLRYHDVSSVVLDNTQGHIHIMVGAAKGVSVERETQTLLAHATSSAYVTGRVLHLTSRCHGTACQVDYRITAPAGVRLRVTAKNAAVSIDGDPSEVAVTNTAEGDVAMSLTRAPRRLHASTIKGSVDISVPHGAYAIAATARNGTKTITGVTASRAARHSIDASTGDGDLTIRGR